MAKYSITCPHCSGTAQYDIGGAFGNTHLNCKNCSKSFKVEYRDGQLKRVSK